MFKVKCPVHLFFSQVAHKNYYFDISLLKHNFANSTSSSLLETSVLPSNFIASILYCDLLLQKLNHIFSLPVFAAKGCVLLHLVVFCVWLKSFIS